MQHRELGRQLISPIIASTRSVALTSSGWRCIHRDAWDEKHHVFFGENPNFFQSTISKFAPVTGKPNRGFETSDDCELWVIQDHHDSPVGRAVLQVLRGDFPQGVLLVDLQTAPTPALQDIMGQLITQALLARELVSLKVVPVTGLGNATVAQICCEFEARVMTFSNQHLPETQSQKIYQLDLSEWLKSAAGQKAMVNLSWLKRRMDRINSAKKSSGKTERRSLLFSILTLGRGRRGHEKMIHPLKKILP